MVMITVVLVLVALWIVFAFLKGLVRGILVIAGLAFVVFFLAQPAAVSPSVRAAIAAQSVVHAGHRVSTTVLRSRIVVREWQFLLYTVRHTL